MSETIASRLLKKGKGPGNCMVVSKAIMKKQGRNTAILIAALSDYHDMLVNRAFIPAGHPFYMFWSMLTERTGMCRNTLLKHLRKLEELGLINMNKGDEKAFRYYKLHIDKIIEAAWGGKKNAPDGHLGVVEIWDGQNLEGGKIEQGGCSKQSRGVFKNDQPGWSKKSTPYKKDFNKDAEGKEVKKDGVFSPSAGSALGDDGYNRYANINEANLPPWVKWAVAGENNHDRFENEMTEGASGSDSEEGVPADLSNDGLLSDTGANPGASADAGDDDPYLRQLQEAFAGIRSESAAAQEKNVA